MSDRGLGQLPNILPFAPGSKEGYQRESDPREEAPLPADGLDNAGQTIMGLLQEAATAAKENCGRALGVAHSLSVRLRAAEDRIKELEAELQHFQDRALRANRRLEKSVGIDSHVDFPWLCRAPGVFAGRAPRLRPKDQVACGISKECI